MERDLAVQNALLIEQNSRKCLKIVYLLVILSLDRG